MAHSVLAVVLSLLTTYLAVVLLKGFLYHHITEYDSFVSGSTSYYNYYKAGDKTVVYLFLLGTVAGYFFWTFFINFVRKYELYQEISFYGICGVAALTIYQRLNRTLSINHLLCYGLLILLLALCLKKKERLYATLQFLIYTEILGTSLVMLGTKVYMYKKGREISGYTELLFFSQCAVLVLSIIFAVLYQRKIKKATAHKMIFMIQSATPVWMLWYCGFVYLYRGEVVVRYGSALLIVFFMAIFALWFIKNLSRLGTEDFKKLVTANGALEVAAMFTYVKIPVGVIQTEPIYMFHYGEYAVSTQQLFSYGKLPFFDYFPIHGLCDYYFGVVNKIFYQGTYATFEAALVVGSAILMAVLAWVLKKSTKNHTLLLVMILGLFNFSPAFELYYIRWVFVLPYLLILNLNGIYKNKNRRVWLYVMLSIASICWNPSIGGSLAIAMLFGMYRDIFEVLKEIVYFAMGKRAKVHLTKRFWISYGMMLLTGMGFVYPFYKIVKYILLHMENLEIVNSNPLLYAVQKYGVMDALSLETLEKNYFYLLFAFLIPLVLLFLIKRIAVRENKAQIGNVILQMVVLTLLMTNYIFGLIGEGERAFIYAGILILFVICILAGTKVESRYRWVRLALMFLLFMVIKPVNLTDYVDTSEQFANMKSIDEEAVYVGDNEEVTCLAQLKDSYMTLEGLGYLNHLNDLAGMVGDKNEIFDMSNMVSSNSILDMNLMTPYSSAFNMYNETMQKHVVGILKQRQPKVVLLSPYFSDSRPLSARNYWLIRYFQEENYIPYTYEDILFLARKDVEVTLGTKDIASYAEFITPSNLEHLAYYWGGGQVKEKYIAESEKLFLDYTNVEVGKYIDVNSVSEHTDFVRITAYAENEFQGKAVLYVKLNQGQVIEMLFDIRNGEMLIPVGLNPYVAEKGNIQGVALQILELSEMIPAELGIYAETSIDVSQWQ